MNRCYSFLFILLITSSLALAQRNVTLQHYQSNAQYYQLNVPLNSLLFSRFQTTAPCSLKKVTLGVYSAQATGDSIEFFMFRDNGGAPFPYLLQLLSSTVKPFIPANMNGNLDINIDPPIVLNAPTTFYVGIRKGWQNANIKMDAVTQTPSCINADGDTMITSGFAVYDPVSRRYGWGYKFTGGALANNFYISVDVEYFNETPAWFFTDMILPSGIDPNTVGRRMAWGDYNNDGYQDLLTGNKLYRNKKDGTFEDVGVSSGFTQGSDGNMFADFDNDGDLDIICEPANLVYVNSGGTFTLKSTTGLQTSRRTRSIAIADYDGDKFPDVFVANGEYMYVKNPLNPGDSALVTGIGYQSYLYKGNGDNTFADKTTTALNGYSKSRTGFNPYSGQFEFDGYRALEGAQWSDFDNDGDIDIFVSTGRGLENYLFVNQGNQKFLNLASNKNVQGNFKAGTGNYGHAIGCEWGDFDNNGSMDLIVANQAPAVFYGLWDKTSLYKNNGAPNYNFSDQQPTARIDYNENHADVAWGDFNNDGLLDLYITGTNGCYKSELYQQNPDHTFTNVTHSAGVSTEDAWGATWVDYDNDGDLDLAVISSVGLQLFRNDVNNQNKWAEFLLKSTTGNGYAIGARVTVVIGSKKITKEVAAGKGAGSQNPYVMHFGLEIYDRIDSVIIRWPKGNIERLPSNVLVNLVNKITTIIESQAAPKPIIMVTPPNVTFTNVAIGSSAEQTLTVRNGGTADLIINSQSFTSNPENQFAITQAVASPIAPNSSSSLKVKFQPTSPGVKTALYQITSNDPDNPTTTITINGTPIVSVKELPGIPKEMALYQNYPNPFSAGSYGNPSTELQYDVSEDAVVRIRVYNTQGAMVTELVNGEHHVGKYSVTFDAGSPELSLSSGIFRAVMHVKTKNGIESLFTRTMVFVR